MYSYWLWSRKKNKWCKVKDHDQEKFLEDNKLPTDPINPAHYKGDGLEVIDVIEAFGLQHDYYLATAIKYILRAGKKASAPAAEDIAKAIWFWERFKGTAGNKWQGTATFDEFRRVYSGSLSETKQTEHLADGIEDSGESARVRSSGK